MRPLSKVLALMAYAPLLATCGRTPIDPTACMILVDQESLDFGAVLPGESSARQVRLMNVGGQACPLSPPAFAPGSDPWFLTTGDRGPSLLAPREIATYTLAFQPKDLLLPLSRTGEFRVDIHGANQGQVSVPVTARIKSDCRLAITPAAIEFGTVHTGDTATQTIRVENQGKGQCEVRGVALDPDGDPQFTLRDPIPPIVGMGPTQAILIQVAFTPTDRNLPRQRLSAVQFTSNDDDHPAVAIPLSADIDIGCELAWSPPNVDFGEVTLNKTVTATVTLKNTGTSECRPTDFAFTADSHPDFGLDPTRRPPVRLSPGASGSITLAFTAADIDLPHAKTATFVFRTTDERRPEARIPLTATVDTFCKEESKWVYTMADDNTLAKFDPATKTFTTIARLSCPGASRPNSMAVDQYAMAWVAYDDGNLFKVDTATGSCEPTTFVPSQEGITVFGMGFVFDPATNLDTLYIAGGATTSDKVAKLATISFPQMKVGVLGVIDAGMPELSGTGDGALWGFFPSRFSATGQTSLVRIDPPTGKILESHEYPGITSSRSWAMKFWGGSFWLFLDDRVYEVKREDPNTINLVIESSGYTVVGAGVSSCAPLRN